MADRHKEAGRLGGLIGGKRVVELYGLTHMSEIGKLGGRPTWQEANEKAWAKFKTEGGARV